jgi:surface polysaccharide O-acyltransferase-like enzyme
VLVFSYFSLLRYIPWLLNGGFSDQVIFQQKLITWVVPVLFTAGVFILEIVQFSHQNSSSKKKARTKVQ